MLRLQRRNNDMARYSVTSLGDGHYSLSGKLDFESVPDLLEESLQWFQNGENISIDFDGVESANSAGMAVLIEWKSIASAKNLSINYKNIPTTIEHLADVCKVYELLKN